MGKTFFPNDSQTCYIDASSPHPENTQYKIAIGLERWGDRNHEVVKVQMVYDCKIAGRRSPSYPIGTDDYKRVSEAVNNLLTKSGRDNS